jgi:protein-S-isoprenylcysteine O-methyltransferase Ste14
VISRPKKFGRNSLFPGFLAWAASSLPVWVHWIGAVPTQATLLLLAWTQWSLSKNLSTTPRLRQGRSLVTDGPYHRVRHLIYTALFLLGVGFLLLAAN